jgi:hypothetical protein
MERVQGNNGIAPVECINPRYNKYRVRWDFQPYTDENGVEGVTFYEAELYSPTFEQIQETVLNGYNAIIDERIMKGFTWNGMPVWLSHENQFNYKAAYDLAVQTNGANLPVTFKFGTTIQPIYHTFTSVDELHGFYLSAMAYINDTLATGWTKKDAIDWTPYVEALANLNKE